MRSIEKEIANWVSHFLFDSVHGSGIRRTSDGGTRKVHENFSLVELYNLRSYPVTINGSTKMITGKNHTIAALAPLGILLSSSSCFDQNWKDQFS